MSNALRNVWAVTRVVLARLRFVAVFAFAAMVIGYWDHIRNHVDRWTRPAAAPDSLAHASDTEFYCPMHPDVIRDEQGQCPKCGMPLVKRKKGQAQQLPVDVLARVTLTPRRLALAGIGTTAVIPRELLREIHIPAVIDYDETRLARISAWVGGRADELFVRFTGQAVKKGDPLYSLYSPEVFTALRQYLLSRKRVNDLPKDSPMDAKNDASLDYNATMQKLVLWGISQTQLDQIDDEFDKTGRVPTNLTVTSPIGGVVVRKDINSGQYVQAGDSPYAVADLSRLWLQLKLYERDVPLVQIGDPVEITAEAFPNQTFIGAVTFKAFQLDPETRTLDARVEIDNPGQRLQPGMYAGAVIRIPVGLRSSTTTAPFSRPTGRSVSAVALSAAYREALSSYLDAQTRLSKDSVEGVTELLKAMLAKLEPVAADAKFADAYRRLSEAIAKASGKDLEELRKTFQAISAGMIEMGKSVGLPPGGEPVNVFNCSMKKADWLQVGDQTTNPYYGSRMYRCGSKVGPLPAAMASGVAASATTLPLSVSPSAPDPEKLSSAFRDALVSYLQAQKKLADDKPEGVPALLKKLLDKLGAVKDAPSIATLYPRLAEAVDKAAGDSTLPGLRLNFQEVSACMIEIGRAVGIPDEGPAVKVFRCPMKKANWLAEGDAVANPYYGSEMYACGSAVDSLPRAAAALVAATSRPAGTTGAAHALAVPRSAVIDTGKNKIVYVESSPGVFDMRAVKLGPLAIHPVPGGGIAEEYYPVVDGLTEGDRVVTVGTFLVDAENRLNPTRASIAGDGVAPTGQPKTAGHNHGM